MNAYVFLLTSLLLYAPSEMDSLSQERYYWIISIILGLICFGTIILDLRGAMAKLRKKMNNRIRAVIRLRGIVEEDKEKINCLESNVGYLFTLHTEMVEKLFLLYYNKPDVSEDQSGAVSSLYPIVENIVADGRFRESLEYGINLKHDDIMVKFREDFPRLNEWEYDLLLYYMAGFTARTIGLLMKVEPPTVHKRKANLKRKILESGKTNKEKYLKWV